MSSTRFVAPKGAEALPAVTVVEPPLSLVTKLISHGEQVLVLRMTKVLSSSTSPSVSIRTPSLGVVENDACRHGGVVAKSRPDLALDGLGKLRGRHGTIGDLRFRHRAACDLGLSDSTVGELLGEH